MTMFPRNLSISLVAVAGVALAASGATRTFAPTVKASDGKYYWTNAGNWTDENGQNGVPQAGDHVVVTGNETVWSVQPIKVASLTLRNVTKNIGLSGSGPSYAPDGFLTVDTPQTPTYWLGIAPAAGQDLPVNVLNPNGGISFDESITGAGRLVKRGPGLLVLGSKAPKGTPGVATSNTRDFSWHGTVVEAGKVRFGRYDYKMTNHELVFSGNDPSARILLNNSDQTFVNVNFYESNGVANVDHGFASQTTTTPNFLRFTGSPVQQPTVFSGKLYNKVGFVWAPDAATDTFVFSNAVSMTTGSLTVSNGAVRLVTGATFTSLENLTVASGATVAIEAGSGVGFSATATELAAGGVLTLGDGCDISLGRAAFAGSLELGTRAFVRCPTATGPDGALAGGRYTKDNAPWISGEGTLIVGAPVLDTATWTGQGATTSLTDPVNWNGGVLPELESGGTTATFGTGGSSVLLGATDEVMLNGIVLARGADFTFDAAAGAKPVGLSGQGIGFDAGAAPATYSMNWPLRLVQEQTWKLGGNTLKVQAPLSGATPKLTVAGPGRAEFSATSSYAGNVFLTNGTFYLSGDNPCCGFGSSLNICLHKDAAYHFGSGVYDCAVNALATSDNNYPPMDIDANADVVFNGAFDRTGYIHLRLGAGSKATFRNGFISSQIVKLSGTGNLVVTNQPLRVGDRFYMMDAGGVSVDLWAAGNKISGLVGEQGYGRINTHVPYALVAEVGGSVQRLNLWGDFVLDLCGNDQQIGIFGGGKNGQNKSGKVVSEQPALLHLVSDYAYTEGQIVYRNTNSTEFAGCAGFSKEGTKVPFFLNGLSSTTGTLQVVAGDLTLLEKASWPNSTNVVVKGGQLHLTHKDTFGKQIVVSVSGAGKLDLAAGVVQRCAAYVKDGVQMPSGTYGATGSGAMHIDDEHFAGTGSLMVGEFGTLLLVR